MEILEFINPPVPADKKKDWLLDLAQKTHAYTGGDIARLVLNAKKLLGSRLDEEDIDPTASEEQRFLTKDDLDNALCTTRPTAMHDINLKPPTIHWQDVGGQENLKKVLARMIRNAKVSPIFVSTTCPRL
jgi:AAA family ATPase